MPRCYRCNEIEMVHENADGSYSCDECGNKFRTSRAAPVAAPVCETPSCRVCGAALETSRAGNVKSKTGRCRICESMTQHGLVRVPAKASDGTDDYAWVQPSEAA